MIVDLPVKIWGEVGRCAEVLWKNCFPKAIERRPDNADCLARPVALWADELQFLSTKNDFLFHTTARSSGVAKVHLSQSMAGLIAALGCAANGKARVEALLANLDTKMFHADSDRDTNQLAADQIGKARLQFRGSGSSLNFSPDGGGCA